MCVVKHFGILEKSKAGRIPRGVGFVVDQLGLERAEETFDHSVVAIARGRLVQVVRCFRSIA